jgi:TctA family transporter
MTESVVIFAIIVIAASMIGFAAGMLPSLTGSTIMISLYPWLQQFDLIYLFCFYASMILATQFGGSVSTLLFGIVGEPTSMPVYHERNLLITEGALAPALLHTAISSAVASILALICVWTIVPIMLSMTWMFRTEIVMIFLLMIFLLMLSWRGNVWWINLGLITAGSFLGAIGFDPVTREEFFTFDNAYLWGGLPTVSVILGLFAVPALLDMYRSRAHNNINTAIIHPTHSPVSRSSWSMLRGHAVGFVSGLIPWAGFYISSTLAYFLENKINSHNTVTHSLRRISAAEAANNSCQISVLIPLLVFGIPITPSEVILFDIISQKSWSITESTGSIMAPLAISLLIVIAICYIMSWKMAVPLGQAFLRYRHYAVWIVAAVILASVVHVGSTVSQSTYYLAVFAVCSLFAVVVRRYCDLMPMLMAFMLWSPTAEAIQRLQSLYF